MAVSQGTQSAATGIDRSVHRCPSPACLRPRRAVCPAPSDRRAHTGLSRAIQREGKVDAELRAADRPEAWRGIRTQLRRVQRPRRAWLPARPSFRSDTDEIHALAEMRHRPIEAERSGNPLDVASAQHRPDGGQSNNGLRKVTDPASQLARSNPPQIGPIVCACWHCIAPVTSGSRRFSCCAKCGGPRLE